MAARTITVDESGAGRRLDSFLAAALPEYSRSFWQKRCEQGLVTGPDGMPLKPSHTLAPGEQVQVELPAAPDLSAIDIPVLYEDDDVLVLNKPAGLLTHAKGMLSQEATVAEFMRPRTTDGPGTNRPGIVHRLDRGTSGVIIAAKTPEAKRWLQKQFAERKAKKTYLALVAGAPKEPQAIIDAPIERNPKRPQTFRVGGNGKPAQTEYQVAEQLPGHSLLRLRPKTGRTHQLRVHLAYIGCPIAGDELYGTAKPQSAPSPGRPNRLFLHAAELELTLPSRERRVFVAPLPPELEAYLLQLRKQATR